MTSAGPAMAARASAETPDASRRAPDEAPPPVVVPENGSFEGLLAFSGCASVEGRLAGEIVCRGTLQLTETSVVVAAIEADELIIAGVFEGDATAATRIELRPTAHVRGDIHAPRIAMADGSTLEGRCEITQPGPAAPSDRTEPG